MRGGWRGARARRTELNVDPRGGRCDGCETKPEIEYNAH